MKLKAEELKKVNGGSWDPSTLPKEEQDEMDRLIDAYDAEGLFEFLNRMDAKYGYGGYDVNNFLG